uniref:Alpha-N-acetylglucosaminidase n=1 Tax=Chenopodium quinoa TaxID=63459 RepID=A0A803LC15_CHEQI
MNKIKSLLPILALLLIFQTCDSSQQYPEEIRSVINRLDSQRSSPTIQENAAKSLLQRLLPSHSSSFIFNIISKDVCGGDSCFRIENYNKSSRHGPQIVIKGTTAVEIASGLHWYLKYLCGAHISWEKTGGVQMASIPDTGSLPFVKDGGLVMKRPVPWNYYQNVVTSSYSFVWWDWQRWEKEIDWMALQGINLPLAFTGQEAIWQKVFADFIVSKDDLNDFFGGPAFLAWARMGNLHGDTFNENSPPTDDPTYISSLGAAVYEAMVKGDKYAVWLMQALLHSVPKGKMVVLDLFAEVKPVWETSSQFYGTPYVWCMLHNFGGNIEMYGVLDSISSGPIDARTSESSTMVGVGMCMEGIEHNPVVYELMSEMAYRNEKLQLVDWIKTYSHRRYGKAIHQLDTAWEILYHTIYNCTDGIADHNKDYIVEFPDWDPVNNTVLGGTENYQNHNSFNSHRSMRHIFLNSGPSLPSPHLWYPTEEVIKALRLFLDAGKDLVGSSTYRYDLVDLTRQALSKLANDAYLKAVTAFQHKDLKALDLHSQKFIQLIKDIEKVLASDENFLLGTWLDSAKRLALNPKEMRQYEWNARTQITMWFDTTETNQSKLHDYANKFWSGLLEDYYLPRATTYFNHLRKALQDNEVFKIDVWRREWISYSNKWQSDTKIYPKKRRGDALSIASRIIKGTTAVEIASGLHWYLKYLCGAHISWEKTGGVQMGSIPEPGSLPFVKEGGLVMKRPVPLNYHQNVFTSSYSYVWWDWQRWEREIDWMALQGINLPLAFTGQEAIWQKVFADFNISKEDLNNFFGGPAFLSWARMGNLHGWDGPLSQNWLDQQLALQKQILTRMLELGMTPVLPSFSGHVPAALRKAFPSSKITRLGKWKSVSGDARWCCTFLLDPSDPLFVKLGEAFIKKQIKEYGDVTDIYNCMDSDTFNENLPPTDDPTYLSSLGAAVYEAMAKGDKHAVWLMQAITYFFLPFLIFPALLHSVPKGKMIVLHLFADVKPIWEKSSQFYGTPYIWCMLHNFGGNMDMYGLLDSISSGPVNARSSKNSTIVGVGMCMEGIEQNPVMYELMSEMAYRNEKVELVEWIKTYSRRRYGKAIHQLETAWEILYHTIYNCTDMIGDHTMDYIVKFPDWDPVNNATLDVTREYEKENLLILHKRKYLVGSLTFRYDLVDLTRQVLSKLGNDVYLKAVTAFQRKDLKALDFHSQKFIQIIKDIDEVVATDDNFLLGTWLDSAKRMATNPEEMRQYEWNARTQVTMWFDTTENHQSKVHDYGKIYYS